MATTPETESLHGPAVPEMVSRDTNVEHEERLTAGQRAAEADYQINVKAELELMRLHKKLDRLNNERVKELVKLQEEQMDILRALLARNERGPQ